MVRGGDEHVGALEVAVDHTLAVHALARGANLLDEAHYGCLRQRLRLRLHKVFERPVSAQLHDEHEIATLVLGDAHYLYKRVDAAKFCHQSKLLERSRIRCCQSLDRHIVSAVASTKTNTIRTMTEEASVRLELHIQFRAMDEWKLVIVLKLSHLRTLFQSVEILVVVKLGKQRLLQCSLSERLAKPGTCEGQSEQRRTSSQSRSH
mmetsp:Transcript_8406/g.27925  ORF Transcript_8406/g.27925 Transcript_8406/m.27925 type:complete len:206 (-) Transcript_8406:1389-2006(-)